MLSFLAGDGEQARRIRDHHWDATPLGGIGRWPAALRTLVGVMLGAGQPMFVAWGPERTLLYNDAYAPLLADRHPHALGRPFMEVWAEARADLSPLFDRVFAGEPVHMDDIELSLDRPGRPREAHFAFSYSPVRGEGGVVAGLFCPCTETTEQVLAQRALRAERDRYDAVLNGMAEGFALMDRDFRIVQLNDEAMRLEARPHDAIVGLTHWEAYPGSEDSAIGRLYKRAMAGRVPVALEHRYRWEGGREAWLDMRAYPVGDGLAVFYRDVSDRKRAEAALHDSQARLQAVFDTVPVGLVLAEAPSGRITGGNAQVEAIFGHPVLPSPDAEAYGEWESRHADGRRVEAHEYPLTPVVRGEADRAELEVLYRRGDGRDAWVRLIGAPIRDEAGRVVGGVVASLDIDREKRATAELQRLNDTLESQVAERTAERDRLWRNTQDIQVVIDRDGVFRAVNPAFSTILGWSPDEVIGRTVFDFVLPDDESPTESALARARREALPTFENRYRHKEGGFRHISWVATPDGRLIYASGRDVTAERERADELAAAQDQLRQAQKMEAVGQLTGGIAHDFNNLLTVIRGSVDLLRRADLTPDRRARYVDAIGDTADRAARLTGQLLAFARRQALKPEAFDVRDRLRAVADMLDSVTGAPVRIELSLPDEPCVVRADPGQFETALVNMAVNARDAMGGEGVLAIAVACRRPMPEVRGHGGGPGPFVTVALSDTGGGIAPDALPHLFEPFFTTKEVGRGTGLGLSQVFGFAKQSGGDVAVDSEPGRGATFTLYLPQVDAVPAEAAAAPAAAQPAPESLRVLVVEDNLEVGRFATEALADCGHETHWVASAEEALDRLGAHGDGFDVVFSDVVMPGMGGLELARRVAERLPDLPVVLASGYSHVLAQEGAHGFELLGKPYSADDLSRTLARAARAGGRAPSPAAA